MSPLHLAQSFVGPKNVRDPWLQVCEFVFKFKAQVQEANGRTIFEKLQGLGKQSKEANSAFAALMQVAKDIRATEIQQDAVATLIDRVFKHRVCIMMLWVNEGGQACCIKSLDRGSDKEAAAFKLCLEAVMVNIQVTLDQVVEYDLPTVVDSDKFT